MNKLKIFDLHILMQSKYDLRSTKCTYVINNLTTIATHFLTLIDLKSKIGLTLAKNEVE